MKGKYIIIVVIMVIFLIFGGVLFFWQKQKKKDVSFFQESEKISEATLINDYPYVSLIPSEDGHWLTIDISQIKNGEVLEYELLYNTASGATQGSINSVNLNGKTLYNKKILLGSESKGHYKYDEGVNHGSLTVRLRNNNGVKRSVTEFHLQKGGNELTSIDGNFSLKGKFSQNSFFLVMNTIGLPGIYEGEVISGPYAVFTSGSKIVNDGVVSFRLSKDTEKAEIYLWRDGAWKKEERQLSDGVISAKVTSLTTFILAK